MKVSAVVLALISCVALFAPVQAAASSRQLRSAEAESFPDGWVPRQELQANERAGHNGFFDKVKSMDSARLLGDNEVPDLPEGWTPRDLLEAKEKSVRNNFWEQFKSEHVQSQP